jgi:hypothetical protein
MNADYSRGKFQEAIRLAQQYGGLGDSQMTQALNTIGATSQQQGVPWLVWQVVRSARSGDYEFFTNDRTAWAAFEHQAYWAQMSPSPFQFPEIWSLKIHS